MKQIKTKQQSFSIKINNHKNSNILIYNIYLNKNQKIAQYKINLFNLTNNPTIIHTKFK